MRLAISNLAWDRSEDQTIAELLNHASVDAIDIAPSKYFADIENATETEISTVKNWWSSRGIEITGMQALLFGTNGLNVFGSKEVQDKMLRHLEAVARIGGRLGAKRLVFGSPKNRDCSGLSEQKTIELASHFFRRLGDIAHANDVVFCLEPNPERYGANFMTSSPATARVVAAISHPSIAMQFDTGAMAINAEDPIATLESCAHLVGHVHASEPDLLTLGDGNTDHAAMGNAISQYLPKHIVCIEMLAANAEPHVVAITRALDIAVRNYRHGSVGVGK